MIDQLKSDPELLDRVYALVKRAVERSEERRWKTPLDAVGTVSVTAICSTQKPELGRAPHW